LFVSHFIKCFVIVNKAGVDLLADIKTPLPQDIVDKQGFLRTTFPHRFYTKTDYRDIFSQLLINSTVDDFEEDL